MIQFLLGLSCRIIQNHRLAISLDFIQTIKILHKKNMSALFFVLLSFVYTKCHALQKAGAGWYKIPTPPVVAGSDSCNSDRIHLWSCSEQPDFSWRKPKKEQSWRHFVSRIGAHFCAKTSCLNCGQLHLFMAWIKGRLFVQLIHNDVGSFLIERTIKRCLRSVKSCEIRASFVRVLELWVTQWSASLDLWYMFSSCAPRNLNQHPSLHYQPKLHALMGNPLKFTIHLHEVWCPPH